MGRRRRGKGGPTPVRNATPPSQANSRPAANATACACDTGFNLSAAADACVDLDECRLNGGYCRVGAAAGGAAQACCHRFSSGCVNMLGSFRCGACQAGFVGTAVGAARPAHPTLMLRPQAPP